MPRRFRTPRRTSLAVAAAAGVGASVLVAAPALAHGYTSDPHEFTMASHSTAYVNSFRNVVMDLSKYGGLKKTPVMDNVAQEVDLRTGQVIWEWHSLGNIRVPETYKEAYRAVDGLGRGLFGSP